MLGIKNTYILLCMTVMTGMSACKSTNHHSSNASAENTGWTSLFNGHNLDGWTVECIPKDRHKTYWTVKDNAITCNSLGDKDHDYVWLLTEQTFGDFELRLKFKAWKNAPGNSGVQVRSRYDNSPDAPRGGWMDGPQIDIHPPAPFRTGLVYDETREERRWIYPDLKDWKIDGSYAADKWTFKYADEGWNEMTIICDGTHIKTVLNGEKITDWDGAGVLDNEAHKARQVDKSGHIALQLHAGDELLIRFKDIKIKPL